MTIINNGLFSRLQLNVHDGAVGVDRDKAASSRRWRRTERCMQHEKATTTKQTF